MTFEIPPAPDQIEISLFGPGFGECCVIHFGNDRWGVVDSCIHSDSRKPAALHYLDTLGVDLATAVRLIIATHWHADHIRGISQILAACVGADFCASSALTAREFLTTVALYEQRGNFAGGSGTEEIFNVMKILGGDPPRRPLKRAISNRPIVNLPAIEFDHGCDVSVVALSPSDGQFDKFLAEITQLMPSIGATRRRATPQPENLLSVVTWITIGELAVLLGGDLQETTDEDTGWSVIVASRERPPGKAQIFKIPHHGADNAHSNEVWAAMLDDGPFAVLTPYNRGRVKRPSPEDVERVNSYTPDAYITSVLESPRAKRRSAVVERTVREQVGQLRYSEPPTGCVRLRNGGAENFMEWSVELFGPASHLAKLNAS